MLVHAHRPEMPLHVEARATVRELAEGRDPWAIPLHCLVEFAGVVTRPTYWVQPSDAAAVERQVAAWTASPTLRVLTEDERFWPVFAVLIERRCPPASDEVGQPRRRGGWRRVPPQFW